MTHPTGSERDIEQAKTLLQEYCFDLEGFAPGELVAVWREHLEADPSWIRSAIVEALYQGRYKAYSVEQILRVWKRRGHPLRHYNNDFERIVSGPIDPTASKYAAMTTLSPSELMKPQADRREAGPDSPAAVSPPEAASSGTTTLAIAETPQRTEATDPSSADPNAAVQAAPSLRPTVFPPASSQSFHQPQPIRKFVPPPASSQFYYRLQSVARHPFQP